MLRDGKGASFTIERMYTPVLKNGRSIDKKQGFPMQPTLKAKTSGYHTTIWLTEAISSPPQLYYQVLNFGMIVSSALMIWKGLMVVTGSESPIVVVLRFVIFTPLFHGIKSTGHFLIF